MAVYVRHASHSFFETLYVKHILDSQKVTFMEKNAYLYIYLAIVFLVAIIKTNLNHELVTKDG
jgi:hypothetical protein